MVKKIIVFMLLFAFLVGVVAPDQAKAANSTETTADDVKYADIEEFMHGAGYYEFVKQEDVTYFALLDGDYLYLYEHYGSNIYMGYTGSEFWSFSNKKVMCYKYYNFTKASQLENYSCLQSFEVNTYSKPLCGKGAYFNEALSTYYLFQGALDVFVYTDMPIYSVTNVSTSSTTMSFYKDTSVVLFESTKYEGFNFPVWCQYAGLNCLASSNESSTVIPYSFNSYWHIVRKSSSGNWLLTTIGSTLGQSKMNLRLSDSGNLIIYEYSGEDSFTISVRQYIYDTDGWLVRTYDTYDYDDFSSGLLTLPAGSGLDDTRVLAYTSTDIYSSDGLSVYAAASTEYVEPSAPDVTPEPTTAPDIGSDDTGSDDSGDSDDSGSSGGGTGGGTSGPGIVVGGNAETGGLMALVLMFIKWVWTDLFAIEVPVDGYQISMQQVFIYGAIIALFVWAVFGRKKG